MICVYWATWLKSLLCLFQVGIPSREFEIELGVLFHSAALFVSIHKLAARPANWIPKISESWLFF